MNECYHKEHMGIIIEAILCIGFILAVCIGVVKCSREQDEKEWNNGYCECGGHFEYEQAVGHQYSTSYIYKCDNCGRRIEVSSTMGGKNESHS